MPLKKNIKRVMVIGSGPIVIGQAAEFDYAGTQACRALKEEGLEVILVNSNPATIMTDNAMADKIYIEPLTLETVKRIIKKERPDSLLSTLGGQTGLTLSMQLAKEGFLDKYNVQLLGANPETIDKAEDRQLFKDTMIEIGQPVIPSLVVTDVESAVKFADEIGYPVIIRPAFTLGGTGGGIVDNEEELREITSNGLELSPITQVLVEKCISGWKEIEFEVMRDSDGNVITVCSMENFDPVGVHTGDSIVIAPTVTLADKEYQMLRSAALNIISALKVEGGCNCQFALNPETFEYAVIEVNPRVSRSSALASKATGYPIAKVAAKIAIGYTLNEIKNAVTGTTYACFEPALDYVVVKFPKWPFDKFVYAKRTLGTQMKATGEVMAIAPTFEQAIMKAVRGAEISHDTLNDKEFAELSNASVYDRLSVCDDRRIFCVYEALKRGITVEQIHNITLIDEWFLEKLKNLIAVENELKNGELTEDLYVRAKNKGFLDRTIEKITGRKVENPLVPVYKMVDTCAAEFEAETPYFYSTFDKENEAEEFIKEQKSDKKTVIVFGSGPIRIGQLTPVFFGSALTNFGVEPFLEQFLQLTTPPLPRETVDEKVEPMSDFFSAFVFKIQANMNKAHRDRVAFMRICSGKFEKNMEVFHVQGNKKMRLSQPQQIMAQEREIVDEAYAGDIIGVFDPGIFSIGDTICSPGHKVQFRGIPTFAPEHFALVRQKDTMKRKQFIKGTSQIAQEGAIQIFQELDAGMEEVIVGVVGVLQFDVLKYRLQNEYNCDIIMETLPYEFIRWIVNDDLDPKTLDLASDTKKIQDLKGNHLLLFTSYWSINWALEHNKGLELAEFGTN